MEENASVKADSEKLRLERILKKPMFQMVMIIMIGDEYKNENWFHF